jgi:choline dehydrogenase-like flavoprotein
VWDQDKCQPKYPKLTSNEEADVVIIGGGIAGLSVAYNLVHDGKKVVVLERATIGKKGPRVPVRNLVLLREYNFYIRAKQVIPSHLRSDRP